MKKGESKYKKENSKKEKGELTSKQMKGVSGGGKYKKVPDHQKIKLPWE